MALVVRSTIEPLQLVESIRKVVRETDPDQPLFNIRTMEQVLLNRIAMRRLLIFLMTLSQQV